MNQLSKIKTYVRRLFNSGLAQPAQWFLDWASGGVKAASGEHVNERTAMGLSSYLACIKNISEDVGKLPLGIYKRISPRGRQEMPNHPIADLLHTEPNPEMSAMTFRETLTQHALGWQGGFAEIVRNGAGVPTSLWPLDPTCVQVRRDTETRKLYYLVHGMRFELSDIFHVHGLGYDGLTGYVLARIAKDPIGNALAAQKFSGSFFSNGITPSGVLEVPGAMSEQAFKHLRESFYERHGGSENAYRPFIAEEGATWKSISQTPRESQMIEVLQSGIEEVARLFRMPPHKIGHLLRSTFSNIEHQSQEYVNDTLMAWLVRWEQEINRKLLMPSERKSLYARHCVNALLRGDSAGRAALYRERFNIGSLSPNDARELEDENPIEGGDAYFVNAAMVPLDMAATGDHLAANQPAPSEPPGKPGRPPYSKAVSINKIAATHTKVIEEAIAGLLRIEHDKVVRASKKPDFQTWAGDFYEKSHPQTVSDRLFPALEALGAALEAVAWN